MTLFLIACDESNNNDSTLDEIQGTWIPSLFCNNPSTSMNCTDYCSVMEIKFDNGNEFCVDNLSCSLFSPDPSEENLLILNSGSVLGEVLFVNNDSLSMWFGVPSCTAQFVKQ